VNLTNLTPFTHYKITVDCIPLLEDDVVIGFWSDEVSVEFTTKEDGWSLYNQQRRALKKVEGTGAGSCNLPTDSRKFSTAKLVLNRRVSMTFTC